MFPTEGVIHCCGGLPFPDEYRVERDGVLVIASFVGVVVFVVECEGHLDELDVTHLVRGKVATPWGEANDASRARESYLASEGAPGQLRLDSMFRHNTEFAILRGPKTFWSSNCVKRNETVRL